MFIFLFIYLFFFDLAMNLKYPVKVTFKNVLMDAWIFFFFIIIIYYI